MAGLLAFVAGTVIDLGEQAISGEDFRLKEVLKEGAVWGSDAAAKTLLSGALMACAKLDKFSFLSKEISADVCTGIACVAFDDLKIAFQIANGKLPVQDGVIKIGETTVISGAGVLAAKRCRNRNHCWCSGWSSRRNRWNCDWWSCWRLYWLQSW